MNLADLPSGKSGRILQVPFPRLLELGLVPGTPVKVTGRGPRCNPVELEFLGTYLLIDRKTAMKTEVRPCDSF